MWNLGEYLSTDFSTLWDIMTNSQGKKRKCEGKKKLAYLCGNKFHVKLSSSNVSRETH